MKVYVVIRYSGYDGYTAMAVYSSEKLAKENYPDDVCYDIEEFEVDDD